MKKYEYLKKYTSELRFNDWDTDTKNNPTINELGEEGWELVSVSANIYSFQKSSNAWEIDKPANLGISSEFVYFFKRPKKGRVIEFIQKLLRTK